MLDNYRKVPKVTTLVAFGFSCLMIARYSPVAKTCIIHGPYEVTGDNNIATIVKTSTFFIWRNSFHVIAF